MAGDFAGVAALGDLAGVGAFFAGDLVAATGDAARTADSACSAAVRFSMAASTSARDAAV